MAGEHLQELDPGYRPSKDEFLQLLLAQAPILIIENGRTVGVNQILYYFPIV